jgi:hypothetical protein
MMSLSDYLAVLNCKTSAMWVDHPGRSCNTHGDRAYGAGLQAIFDRRTFDGLILPEKGYCERLDWQEHP